MAEVDQPALLGLGFPYTRGTARVWRRRGITSLQKVGSKGTHREEVFGEEGLHLPQHLHICLWDAHLLLGLPQCCVDVIAVTIIPFATGQRHFTCTTAS